MLLKDIEKNFPYISVVQYGGQEYVGIIINQEVWTKPKSGEYFFKKAHAYAYAVSVVVHMNLICESLNYEAS